MGMEDRIKELMEAQHVNQQSFADFLGISSATLSSIFSKRTKVTLNTVKAIKEKLPNLNYSWLIDGVGPMFRDSNSGNSNSSTTPSSAATGEGFIDFDGGDPDAVENPSGSESQNSASSGSSSSAANFSSLGRGQQRLASSSVQDGASNRPNPNVVTPKNINIIRRSVSQILVIYDDQTCETFVPKK